MQTETALAEKLKGAGFNTDSARLYMNATESLTNGRDFNVALHVFRTRVRNDFDLFTELCRQYLADRQADMRGDKMGSEAIHGAPQGHASFAAASRINAAKGQEEGVIRAAPSLPDAATKRSGGHVTFADKAKGVVPSASPRPSRAERIRSGVTAIVEKAYAKSLFDTTKLPDGRSLREIRWMEVPQLASRFTFLSRVMTAVHNRGVPTDASATLDQIVSEEELKEIIVSVERLNDIH